jgi:uncharacterized integral membrane protein
MLPLPGPIDHATEADFQIKREQFKRAREVCLDAYNAKVVAEDKRKQVCWLAIAIIIIIVLFVFTQLRN